jgi:hypothetical protein
MDQIEQPGKRFSIDRRAAKTDDAPNVSVYRLPFQLKVI